MSVACPWPLATAVVSEAPPTSTEMDHALRQGTGGQTIEAAAGNSVCGGEVTKGGGMSTHAYVGYERCGHATLFVVDNPDHQKETYREINNHMRLAGARVEHLPIDDARAILKGIDFNIRDHDKCPQK